MGRDRWEGSTVLIALGGVLRGGASPSWAGAICGGMMHGGLLAWRGRALGAQVAVLYAVTLITYCTDDRQWADTRERYLDPPANW